MVWDKILNKLQPVNADSFAADVQAHFFEDDTSEVTDNESDLDLKVMNLRKKIIKRRNKDKQNTYQQYLVKKAEKINYKLKYTDINQSEINSEFDSKKTTFDFMKEKKFNKQIDFIQFSDFLAIYNNKLNCLEPEKT